METALCSRARFQINTVHSIGTIAHLNVPARVEMPISVAYRAELWRDTTFVCEPGLSPILMPLEKEINQRILLQLVISGVLDRA